MSLDYVRLLLCQVNIWVSLVLNLKEALQPITKFGRFHRFLDEQKIAHESPKGRFPGGDSTPATM
jgi:hypothetical protein